MKLRQSHLTWIHTITFLAAIATPSVADQFTLQIENPVDEQRFQWSEGSIWLEGYPPDENSDVLMPSHVDEEGNPVYLYVEYGGDPLTINSLFLDWSMDLQIYRSTFTVSGSYSGNGSISIQDGTLSLGTNANYNPSTKTLEGGAYLVWDYSAPNQSIMEWEGADIRTNQAYLLFWGTNAVLRDENNTTGNAMEFFSRNEGSLALEDGYQMNVTGNFTNATNGYISMNRNPWVRTPKLDIAGNFVNEGEVVLYGNSVLNVAGGYSGSGTIESYGSQNQISVLGAYVQTGGRISVSDGNKIVMGDDLTVDNTIIILKGDGTEITVTGDITVNGGTVDTGPSGVDSTILKARTGIYQNNATISGEGKIVMNVNVNNSYITPGNTPGKLSIEGDLTITGASDIEIELGGTVQGKSYDLLAQSEGLTTLGGTLTTKVIDDFACHLTGTDSFTVLTSSQPLAGSFTNVVSGSRLATSDGLGTFLVTYGAGSGSPNAVVLSDFIAAPVPPLSYADWSVEQGFLTTDPTGDQNDNGIVDMLEYSFGRPSGTPCIYTTTLDEGAFVWTFGIPKYVTGVTITSISFNDLPASVINGGPAPTPAGSTASMNLYTITDSAASPRKFYQLKVELAE